MITVLSWMTGLSWMIVLSRMIDFDLLVPGDDSKEVVEPSDLMSHTGTQLSHMTSQQGGGSMADVNATAPLAKDNPSPIPEEQPHGDNNCKWRR